MYTSIWGEGVRGLMISIVNCFKTNHAVTRPETRSLESPLTSSKPLIKWLYGTLPVIKSYLRVRQSVLHIYEYMHLIIPFIGHLSANGYIES